ncbi:MAG: hypothetical protein JNG84_00995, partial [Archangium sp.]|nr:hypothetical protein [Archangium sp.]
MRRAAVLWLVVGCACSARPPDDGFADHTQVGLRSKDDYAALAATANGRSEVKFIITRFDADGAETRFMDSGFYTLHDEWYWFRLLNGHGVPGLSTAPVSGHTFDSVAAIYAWAKVTTPLPLDLRWVDDGRLYSPRFYTLALDLRPRAFGVGTLLHVPARATRPERWAFQLEFTDAPTHLEVARFFTQLRASLPPDIADALHWVVRSTRQEVVAQTMEHQQLPWHDRILRLEDLASPGEVEVYNEGLTAGRLRFFPRGAPIEGTSDTDVVVLADVPDVLPPAAGVVTATPQTPLAHLNLLARNRGIPNGYHSDVLDDAALLALAQAHTPVVVKMRAPNELIIKPISEEKFAQWLQLRGKAP